MGVRYERIVDAGVVTQDLFLLGSDMTLRLPFAMLLGVFRDAVHVLASLSGINCEERISPEFCTLVSSGEDRSPSDEEPKVSCRPCERDFLLTRRILRIVVLISWSQVGCYP